MTETVSGVTSLSACASRLGISLAQGNEPLHIYTSFDDIDETDGNIAVMKSGKAINDMHNIPDNRKIFAVENCGMENERIYREIPPMNTGYFTVLIIK